MIDPDAGVYPMVGPGKGYREMITGDHINNRYDASGGEREIDASEMF
jgi:acetolactate synthase-1/2/3 large subunit